jgi:hypothetical protein
MKKFSLDIQYSLFDILRFSFNDEEHWGKGMHLSIWIS